MFGRLGVLLTASPSRSTSSRWSRRGMAADPNRVPWGNMYEFTLAGTFVVALIYLAALPAVPARLDGARSSSASCSRC